MSSGDSFLASRKKDVGGPLIETALRNSSMPWDAKGENNKRYDDMKKTEEKVKTARAPASAHLLIDSLDRYPVGNPGAKSPPVTSSAWTLQLPQYVLNGYFTRLAVTQIQFQWNLPTIITGYNNILIVQQPTAPSIAIIPQGWYSPPDLATAITTALAAATTPPTSAITCTYNALNKNFVLTSAAAFRIPPADNNNAKQFGSTTGLQYTGPATATTVVGGVPTMLATRFIDMRSSYLTKNQRVKDVTTLPQNIVSDVIARIYATAPNTTTAGITTPYIAPWIMNISYPVPKYIRWNVEEPISNFTLELLDENGQPLPWTQTAGCEYALTLIASED
jgi:hypothetical protein